MTHAKSFSAIKASVTFPHILGLIKINTDFNMSRFWQTLGAVNMLRSFEGVYRQGKVELFESPPSDIEGKVIVTFLNGGTVDLAKRGIDEQQASDLKHRLQAFADDWDRPEMDVYDAV